MIYALSVVLLFSIMGYIFFHLTSTLSALKEDEKRIQDELKSYEQTIKRIAELEKKIKEIRAKLEVIRELERNKTGPVHLLDEIAMAVPKEKLWLSTMKETRRQSYSYRDGHGQRNGCSFHDEPREVGLHIRRGSAKCEAEGN